MYMNHIQYSHHCIQANVCDMVHYSVVDKLLLAFIIITDSIIILYHVTVPIQICVVVINFARFYNFV